MSWFSDLTDKAGAFLNNLDQVAASSLQEAGIASPSQKSSTKAPVSSNNRRNEEPPPVYSPPVSQKEKSTSVAQVLVGSASNSPHLTPTVKTSRVGSASSSSSFHRNLQSSSAKPSDDDSLFQFLNSPKTSTNNTRRFGHVSPAPTTSLQAVVTMPHPNSAPSLAALDLEDVDLNEPEENRGLAKVRVEADGGNTIESGMVQKDEREIVENESAILYIEDQSTGAEEVDFSEDKVVIDSSMEDFQLGSSENNGTSSGTDQNAAAMAEAAAEVEKWKKTASNLELENKLMKREVASLNEELGGLMGRLTESSQSSAHYQSEIHALREQSSQSDQLIRQLRSQGDDLEAAVQVRDTQIQALRLEIAGTNKELEELKNQLLFSRKEQERLLQDANLSSGAQSQALDSVKAQLTQTEAQLASMREEHFKEKTALLERESLLQAEKVQLSNDLAATERQVGVEQGKVRDYQATMQTLQRELHMLKKEHEDYKQRATGILQAKEKLIQSLQGGGGGGAGPGAAEDARVEEVRLEKEQLQAQLTNTCRELDDTRKELQDLEERSGAELESASEQVRVCEGVLEGERRQRLAVQEDLTRLTQEMQLLREDLDKERNSHRENVQVREKEIADLKLRLTHSVTPATAELESQLHQVTDTLIQKQTAIETLNSERSTLNVQLKRLKDELEQSKKQKASETTVVQMNGLERQRNEAQRVPSMTSVIPSLDAAPTNSRLHNVRRAVNSLDRVSIRLGVFLRRYPQARLFTVLYVVLLHLWVMFVLLTYSPEAHTDPPL